MRFILENVIPPYKCYSLTSGQEFFMCKGIRDAEN